MKIVLPTLKVRDQTFAHLITHFQCLRKSVAISLEITFAVYSVVKLVKLVIRVYFTMQTSKPKLIKNMHLCFFQLK